MRRFLLGGVALLPLLSVSTSVFAAEIPVQARPKAAPARAPARPVAQPAQSTTNWSGSQVGGFNGASNMSNAMVEPGAFLLFAPTFFGSPYTFPSSDPETPFSIHRHPWSYTAGAFLGYNLQFGGYVVGAETDIAWKNGQSSNALYATAFATYPDGTAFRAEFFNGTVKQTWDGSLRARAGFLWTPATLVYGTAGLAYGEVSGSFGYAASIVYPDFIGRRPVAGVLVGYAGWLDSRRRR